MQPFNKREKILSSIVAILTLVVLFLSFKIIDYKIDISVLGSDKYVGPPSMEKSIEDASMVFLCKTVIHGDIVKYRIDKIIYKDEKYEFPYGIGDFFPRLQKDYDKNVYPGEGQVVILSSKPPTMFRSILIMNGALPGFNGISLDDFIVKFNAIKN